MSREKAVMSGLPLNQMADKEAKRIAAATWNKKHPDNPVPRKHKKK
jgi:hypothetical protein